MEYKIDSVELPPWKGKKVKPVGIRKGKKGELYYSSFHCEILEIVDQETNHPLLIVEVEHKEPELIVCLPDSPGSQACSAICTCREFIYLGASVENMGTYGEYDLIKFSYPSGGGDSLYLGHYHDGPKKD